MKQVSDSSHAVAPNSTIQSIDLAKSKTSLPLLCDDMEAPGQRNKLVMETGVKKLLSLSRAEVSVTYKGKIPDF